MSKLRNYLSGNIKEEDMEHLTEQLIRQKFDQEQRQSWSQMLKEQYGVDRNAPSKKAKSLQPLRWLITAAAALALIFSAYFLLQSQQATSQQLADDYVSNMSLMADQLVYRKGTFDVDKTRLNANEAYLNEDFKLAIQYWNSLIDNNAATDYDRFYLSISYLRNSKADAQKAIELLIQIKPGLQSLEQEINWALSLAYMRSGQLAPAQQLLESIVRDQAYMSVKAQQLLRSIKEEQQD